MGTVALFTRAWIEMDGDNNYIGTDGSPSLRGRGLKWYSRRSEWRHTRSPSLRGRGLKSRIPPTILLRPSVALFTRAWIEMSRLALTTRQVTSPSLRGRGLKCTYRICCLTADMSPSLRGRGLKFGALIITAVVGWASPSLRGRGLKYIVQANLDIMGTVALFTRAWIEMMLTAWNWTKTAKSPSLRGRGLKCLLFCRVPCLPTSPSLRGRGLKFAMECAFHV